ncbi:MAG: hypothetical protein CM1200mP16_02720 [Nitrospina sp.]|nr:MAG: hypothetical protein CM1200mP16_02720 [Nitrospina sp.]
MWPMNEFYIKGFSEAAKERKIEVQNLLFPLTVELSAAETEILTPHLERLQHLGLELETFGKNEFLLRSVPAILKNIDNEKNTSRYHRASSKRRS